MTEATFELEKIIGQSLQSAFIDQTRYSSEIHRPQLIVNGEGKQVLPSLLEELINCKAFYISVAFITEGGLSMLKTALLDLDKKGIRGRILTSTYLGFNNPKVFKELLKLRNVDVRLTSISGFHAKGYVFKKENYISLLVGSSNLTETAMKKNYEWNIKFTSLENGELVQSFNNQYEKLWDEAVELSTSWIHKYEEVYNLQLQQKNQMKSFDMSCNQNDREILPNKMQSKALEQIEALRKKGAKRGLIVSATGTGKTFLSAFEVRNVQPEKLLFIVHREQILKKAQQDFKDILGGEDSEYGILSGTSKEIKARYLFATIQSLSKDETLNSFAKEHFDYIIVDEVHRAGASSYTKTIDYFTPDFILGMTATPERTDDFSVYKLFDYNIAYEIRLQEALEEDMLCPFHYFGVTDYEIDGKMIDEGTTIQDLVKDERVNHIINKLEYYGYSGDVLRGLVFCSSKKEARELAISFEERGIASASLTGEDSQAEREIQIGRLENGEISYIFTVDIFNEGIDIPKVNQIIMLRQTQSSIIFIQQLGRGLRKHKSKEYVAIIDFIGNYKNNYLIPIALSGDQTLNKDNTKKNTAETNYIKGISVVNFEEIAKQRIFESIKNTNLSSMKNLRDAYKNLESKVGRKPSLLDFMKYDSVDPQVIIDSKKTYPLFLEAIKEPTISPKNYANEVLFMLSMELLNGKRIHEIVLLKALINNETLTQKKFVDRLRSMGEKHDVATIKSVERFLNYSFFVSNDYKKYGNQPLVNLIDGEYQLNDHFKRLLVEESFKTEVLNVIEVAVMKNQKYDRTPLTIHEKYSRKDICRLLNWENDESGTINGYRLKHKTLPIFITYHKDEELTSSVHYADELLTPELLKWYTKSQRTLDSKEVKNIIDAEAQNVDLHVFIKKEGAEGTDFFYLGTGLIDKNTVIQELVTNNDNKTLPIVTMNIKLKNMVEDSIYHYLKIN
ncbi:DUF3427 domain-containing protein [Kurthia sibirica]|uniref:DUF3427 domain-containing protein n=1 Tax=Kurthia sibirica TaxID=202750 RepID=A0A2U3AP01_9BACL|nr:DEAD/DEAH box helicase [Kurthia sibirica]PWI26272.1 DUF3427 domain-containing protein [Kurthia sibirica]GEK33887.1 helicase [Kurthia sibirica]